MPSKKSLIQRVELLSGEHPVHCPFCGAPGISNDDENLIEDFCEHVLFMGHDAGFEYRSARFDELMNISGVDSEDIDFGDKGLDGFTDTVQMPGSIKFALYTPAPSFFGAYIGFAPVDEP
jgi:hypothetical protein